MLLNTGPNIKWWISIEVYCNYIKLILLMTNDYKDFHGLAPTQAAHRTYLACIQWQPAHTCCCRRTRASLGSLGCCASLLWFRAGWWCCWWQGCCCSYNMDGGNQGDAVAARWWWCYLCKLLWCDGESRTTAMDLVWIVDIQCPKKVKGRFTIFQIIEHHTSLKDVKALKLMT